MIEIPVSEARVSKYEYDDFKKDVDPPYYLIDASLGYDESDFLQSVSEYGPKVDRYYINNGFDGYGERKLVDIIKLLEEIRSKKDVDTFCRELWERIEELV
jgi:hypothetical protein